MARTYALSTTAWPDKIWRCGREIVDELLISPDPDSAFGIEWHDLPSRRGRISGFKVVAHDDALTALAAVLPILLALPHENATPAEVIAALEAAGFRPSEHHGRLAAVEAR